MKIWLNHSLACPDDASYPLKLSIFIWESEKEQIQRLIDSYTSESIYNYRDEESPLSIKTQDSSSNILKENLHQLEEETGIIHIFKKDNQIYFYDTCVINPLPILDYLQYYLDVLDEFSIITDNSDSLASHRIFQEIVEEVRVKIISAHKLCKTISNENIIDLGVSPIFQELLFLNIFLTYLEIKEGLLSCPTCKRWFPILKTIPRIYPKDMKREEMDLDFLKKWRLLFPDDVIMD